ncbi:Histidine transport system permease protein HisQ [Paraburkholderia nemoris]|uniref:ABC transporter permease n=1 Tax=Paraburkholderia nemoris TaxID=2793076 RepID=UPI00191221F5|nr:ABC transporter permease subunit [Paraburkholderia nemoris]MBK5148016.1 ABC transporter permease subunit [Burkholderia sp. R-69608]CAE6875854.1 Histidine transport system permease protein HisQ [Paraburkholderia nemoris]
MVDFTLNGYGGLILLGAVTTLLVALAATAIGSVIGILMAAAKLSPMRILSHFVGAYTTTIRGVPDLLVIFLVYYGGSATLSHVLGRSIEINAFGAGAVSLGLVFGAYATEIFRGAILEVPRGQFEAAAALGLTGTGSFVHVIAPQAWRLAVPAFGNQLTVLLKETALVSLVGLEDLMRRTGFAVEATNRPFFFYLVAGVLYFVLSFALTNVFSTVRRRTSTALTR